LNNKYVLRERYREEERKGGLGFGGFTNPHKKPNMEAKGCVASCGLKPHELARS